MDNEEIAYIFYERSGKYFELFNNQDLADAKAIHEIMSDYGMTKKEVLDIVDNVV